MDYVFTCYKTPAGRTLAVNKELEELWGRRPDIELIESGIGLGPVDIVALHRRATSAPSGDHSHLEPEIPKGARNVNTQILHSVHRAAPPGTPRPVALFSFLKFNPIRDGKTSATSIEHAKEAILAGCSDDHVSIYRCLGWPDIAVHALPKSVSRYIDALAALAASGNYQEIFTLPVIRMLRGASPQDPVSDQMLDGIQVKASFSTFAAKRGALLRRLRQLVETQADARILDQLGKCDVVFVTTLKSLCEPADATSMDAKGIAAVFALESAGTGECDFKFAVSRLQREMELDAVPHDTELGLRTREGDSDPLAAYVDSLRARFEDRLCNIRHLRDGMADIALAMRGPLHEFCYALGDPLHSDAVCDMIPWVEYLVEVLGLAEGALDHPQARRSFPGWAAKFAQHLDIVLNQRTSEAYEGFYQRPRAVEHRGSLARLLSLMSTLLLEVSLGFYAAPAGPPPFLLELTMTRHPLVKYPTLVVRIGPYYSLNPWRLLQVGHELGHCKFYHDVVFRREPAALAAARAIGEWGMPELFRELWADLFSFVSMFGLRADLYSRFVKEVLRAYDPAPLKEVYLLRQQLLLSALRHFVGLPPATLDDTCEYFAITPPVSMSNRLPSWEELLEPVEALGQYVENQYLPSLVSADSVPTLRSEMKRDLQDTRASRGSMHAATRLRSGEGKSPMSMRSALHDIVADCVDDKAVADGSVLYRLCDASERYRQALAIRAAARYVSPARGTPNDKHE